MLRIKTSAKVNLGLEIISKRDDEYHNICSVLQTVNLYDIILVEPASVTTLYTNDDSVNNEYNVVLSAVKIFEQETGISAPVNIRLMKKIPIGMGLGGGSGNAAGILMALNRIYSGGLTAIDLSRMASLIGADVPFFLRGGTAYVSGIGDNITSLPDLEIDTITLVCPKVSIPYKTKTMYQSVTERDFTDGSQIERLCSDIHKSSKTIVKKLPPNAFYQALTKKFPHIRDLMDTIKYQLGIDMYITGTGLGLFTITGDIGSLKRLVDPKYYNIYQLTTTSTGIEMRDD
tara:strand:+ start:6577 stop:7440 length:864 start_codon:yes stop_codon:yes gene_type:complete